ncbi:alpha/beta fold hydrolase [Alteromonas facilis]|uniref:alpha/beta fold hydrolase n=1 Tax=Alteromonas facilis TaxID=2048004 RepID=UPI000C28A937|nr:alpha/beta fold hydrolase [Alteromonas facilis]
MSVLNYEVRHSTDASRNQWAVLIHGLFGNLDNLASIARSLEDTTHCVLLDLPNHGLSPTAENLDYDAITQLVNNTLDEIGIANAHFIGHSLGGKVAMHFALHHPERCNSLIVADIAPVAYPHRHNSVFEGLKNVDLSVVTSRQDALKQLSEHVKELPTQQFLLKGLYRHEDSWQWRFNVDEIIASYPILIDWPPISEQYNNPVLFIIGGNSDYVTPDHQALIRALFPNVKAKIIQGTGHWLHAEKPTIFNRIVNDFIQSVE